MAEASATGGSESTSLDDIPLFATSTPAADAMSSAFQALVGVQEECTPDETALGLREQGNACFRRANGAGLRDALECYTRSLAVKGASAAVQAVTRTNRAAVHLRLGNHGSALADCEAALAADPHVRKAHYRAAEALQHLHRYAAAIDHCDAALADTTTPEHDAQALTALRQQCADALAREQAAAAARKERGEGQYEEIERAAEEELERRGVRIGEPLVDCAQLAAQAQGPLVARLLVPQRVLVLPVVLLYEEAGVVDCVAAVAETMPLGEMMREVLSEAPAWDTQHQYTPDTVELYVELRGWQKPRLGRMRPTTTLRELLAHRDYVLPRVPVFSVISTKSTEFRRAFRTKYD